MKNTTQFLLYSCLSALLFSCGSKESADVNPPKKETIQGESYNPPVFVNDARKEKIKSIAPRLQQLIEDHAQEQNIPGVAYGLVVDDELLISGSTGLIDIEQNVPASTTSAFRIASMTKSFTAMAILKLMEEDHLSLSDPASQYIPEMASLPYLSKDAPEITIENLLTMTAGFPEDNPWGDRQLDEPEQYLQDLISKGISFSNVPAYTYEYSNTGYAILGKIVSQVSGLPYQDYIRQHIFLPLGMEHTYWEYDRVPPGQLVIGYRWEDETWKREPMLHDGSYGAMGGLITSIEDFSKYVSLHLSAWPPRSDEDNGPIVRSSLRAMQTPQFARLNANARDFAGEPCPRLSGYGYGLRSTEFCDGVRQVGHGGALPGFGSNYQFFPEYGVGLMAFGNLTYTSPWPYAAIWELLFETLALKPRELPVSAILADRQAELVRWMQQGDEELETAIFAENFFLDQSRDSRRKTIDALLEEAGTLREIGSVRPENQLRGSFSMKGDQETVEVFFTLSPESDPKIQQLVLSLRPSQ